VTVAGTQGWKQGRCARCLYAPIHAFNCGDARPGRPDEDVTVETAYNADGQVLTLTARNPSTGDQVTRYVYGATLSDSSIARADLLRAEIYPDSDDTADPLGDGVDGVYDRVEYGYNRQGERIRKKDQNETVHAYEYDRLGRPTEDRVTAVGSGVDDAVRRIATTYEVRGMVATITSYASSGDAQGSSSSSGSDAMNQVVFEYDDVGKLVKEHQEHDGLKHESTLYVAYHYDESASGGRFTKGLRATSVRYPNGRLVHYTYGDSGSTADALGRIDAICADDSGSPGDVLAQYGYLGLGTIVQVDYLEPHLRYDLAHGSGDDPCDGLDRFGRVVDLLWRNYGREEDAVRIKHGYDRAGNRLWRDDPVAASYGRHFDELYTYDGMYQLVDMQRGDLNANRDAIVGGTKTFAEDWSLDMTGNWSTYKQDHDGDGIWELVQSRTHNAANELTHIAGASTHVAHDRAGNMIRIPKPEDWSDHYHLEYDAWNRLVSVADSDDVARMADFGYDARNFRVLKRTYDGGELAEIGHLYYNRRWQCLEERVNSSAGPNLHFVWGLRYVDDLILRNRDTEPNGTLDERLYAIQDANWNVNAVADALAHAQERTCYCAYGTPQVTLGSFASQRDATLDWTHRYTGRRLDGDAQLFDYRRRWHAPRVGRLITRDPVGRRAADDNLYRYVRNRPITSVDPFGLMDRYCAWRMSRLDADWRARALTPAEVACFQRADRMIPRKYKCNLYGARRIMVATNQAILGEGSGITACVRCCPKHITVYVYLQKLGATICGTCRGVLELLMLLVHECRHMKVMGDLCRRDELDARMTELWVMQHYVRPNCGFYATRGICRSQSECEGIVDLLVKNRMEVTGITGIWDPDPEVLPDIPIYP